MGCQYCYLGTGTDDKTQADSVVSTLDFAVEQFLAQNITPFNLSFHGGEATAIAPHLLQALFKTAKQHYARHGDAIKQAGYPLNPIHIKTNLYNFDRLYELFDQYQVSVSGSVDLPLFLHEKYRTDKRGRSTLPKIKQNLALLAQYPHHKKISCVVTQEHYFHIDRLIDDIKHIHYDIGLDMSKFNVMFSFDSHKNQDKFGPPQKGMEMLTQAQQVDFYRRLVEAFSGTELEAGLKQHWFKEFTPEFCCSAVNCGDKFFLLQSNGDVYACPRGQSSQKFKYGNVFDNSVTEIMHNGWQTIERIENTQESSQDCFTCNYLPHCNQGCVFVREQTTLTKSYTCQLQKAIYRDNPEKYPPYSNDYIRQYAAKYKFRNNIQSIEIKEIEPVKAKFVTPELYEDNNALSEIIAKDPVLKLIYQEAIFALMVDGIEYPMVSPILPNKNEMVELSASSNVELKIRQDCFDLHCADPVNNFMQLMVLRNTMVVYGDEQREKQEHLFDYAIYRNNCQVTARLEGGFYYLNLQGLLQLHQSMFQSGVRNNLYVTTKTLREYHYNKQRKNAFYHIQAINLPFPFLEFYWRH